MTTTIIIVVLVSPAQMDKISQATLCFSIYLIAPDDHALPIPLMFVFFRFYDHLPTLLTRRRRRRLCSRNAFPEMMMIIVKRMRHDVDGIRATV